MSSCTEKAQAASHLSSLPYDYLHLHEDAGVLGPQRHASRFLHEQQVHLLRVTMTTTLTTQKESCGRQRSTSHTKLPRPPRCSVISSAFLAWVCLPWTLLFVSPPACNSPCRCGCPRCTHIKDASNESWSSGPVGVSEGSWPKKVYHFIHW